MSRKLRALAPMADTAHGNMGRDVVHVGLVFLCKSKINIGMTSDAKLVHSCALEGYKAHLGSSSKAIHCEIQGNKLVAW